MRGSRSLFVLSLAVFLAIATSLLTAQTTTASIQGRVLDSTGAVVPKATVTVTNTGTGYSRTVTTSDSGAFSFPLLPVGDYTVAAEHSGFRKTVQNIHLDLGAAPSLDLALQVGEVSQEVDVTATSEAVEPTRSMVSTVIAERAIQTLPINGRQFIDFALLAPGVTIGDTTSGSTDVIIEPVTKLSFAGQNIHFNFIAVDGADDISTASGVQKSTPSQEAVQEFRVINSDYSTEFGRAVGGIVNIITKSGTNDWHGSVYEYFRNDALDARSILASPGLDELRQNQFGFTIGGPIVKDKTFIFANYEGQRRVEAPFYNSVVLNNIGLINQIKCTNFGTLPCGAPGTLPIENLNVKRGIDYDTALFRLDQSLGTNNQLFARYTLYDNRSTNVSPLNDGFDLPSGFKNNFFRDQSIVGGLNSTLSPTWTNEMRMQYAHRNFEFPTVSTAPHLEVSNTFTMGVNRGNPDGYEENRFEFVDNISKTLGRHTLMFGGNFSWVSTTESFPLFYPFEADFGCLLATQCPFSLQAGAPFVMFFERFQAPNFTEPTIDPAVFQGTTIPAAVHDQAQGAIDHTYEGLFIMDKWNATDRLNITAGLRWEGETWPSQLLDNPLNNWDPRAGFSYRIGTKWNVVLRAGAGIFHGMIPSPLLMCQIPSCGGTLGTYPGRPFEDAANSTTRLFAFASGPGITNIGLTTLLNTGTYPDAVPFPNVCFPGETTLSQCGFFGDAVIVRFAKNHKMPYGIQNSLGLEFEPFRDGVFNISYLGVRGRHLGSFFNVNQPNPSGVEMLHDSAGNVGPKNTFFCTAGPPACPPGTPGTRDPQYAVYFEANSLWSSQYDGLLVNFQKRMRHHWGGGVSYTWSKGIDNGPNPSFVLIPQDNTQFGQERALSADHVAHRFVLNSTFTGPTHVNPLVNDWELGMIVTLESPHYFTKFAGFDANGDIFGNNDRVGIEGRNTFKGDSYQSIDMRIARTFPLTERFHLQGMFEAFNLFNTVNVRFFNTVYGAADFCPIGGAAICGPGPFFFEGSPNPNYGTPRAVFNPRQLQFALRLTF